MDVGQRDVHIGQGQLCGPSGKEGRLFELEGSATDGLLEKLKNPLPSQ